MFNSSARREAIEELNGSVEEHEVVRKQVARASVQLFQQRQRAVVEVIKAVEDYVNLIANSPKEFDRSVTQFRFEVNRFSGTVQRLDTEGARTPTIGSATGTAGIAAGVGVAALGPTAAIAIATTFGTASTGTAISALSGAAATNVALAWLGGGAVAAGGGGMAGGSALLALAGPLGWGIGGTALVGSGLYLNSRNKRYAREATEQRIKVEGEVRSLKTALKDIEGLFERTEEHVKGCLDELAWLKGHSGSNYQRLSQGQKERLTALINHVRALSELLNREVAL